jgi:cystathionine beta-lyase family protein involved in aluminum resistance
MKMSNFLGLSENVVSFCENSVEKATHFFADIEKTAEHNQFKVLAAMQKNHLSDSHFSYATGYGYNDAGRDIAEKIYADVFGTEDALVRPQLISGTHAISTALFANLKYGDEIVLATGMPYDTLQGVIGIRPTRGSLAESGITYKVIPLKEDGFADFAEIKNAVTEKTRIVAVQRSKGYAWRPSYFPEELGKIFETAKSKNKDVICFADNCYGEFVRPDEPTDFGADMIAGSLIKNPGGGIAPVGGYIAGKKEFVENAAFRLTAPGLGKESGPSLGITRSILQGLFFAPAVVAAAVKGAVAAGTIFHDLGYDVLPAPDAPRADIVQAIKLGSTEAVAAFCEGIQKGSPVDSFVRPETWDMPGYGAQVIMAAGAFIQGSSIELSADAPMREPYNVFVQGGLTWAHAKAGIMTAVDFMLKKGLVSIS